MQKHDLLPRDDAEAVDVVRNRLKAEGIDIRERVDIREIAGGAGGITVTAAGPDGAAPSPQLEAFREGLQITEAILHLRAALEDPPRGVTVKPETVAEAKALIQVLMDGMESNRRFRPAGTADLWPYVRRIYELVSEVTKTADAAGGA